MPKILAANTRPVLVALALSIAAVAAQKPASTPAAVILRQQSDGRALARPKAARQLPTGSAVPKGAAANMTWQGGPVQHVQKVYTIFWVPASNPSTFQTGYDTAINQFVQDLNNTSYYSVSSQYNDTSGFISSSLAYGGTWTDTVNAFPRTNLKYADLSAELTRALAANPSWTSDANSYFQFYTPPGIANGDSSGICGLHYTANPAIGQILYPATGCLPGGTYPNGVNVDAAINVSAHEITETLTDPQGDGWWEPVSGDEIADLCNFQFGTRASDGSNVTLNGRKYVVQQLWSNASNSCTLSYLGPSITSQPASQTIASGSTATLSVTATSGGAITYQWYVGTTGTTTSPISGATASSYTTPALTSASSYWVRVTSQGVNVDSNTATISIGGAPIITTQPSSQSVASGGSVTLTVTAQGTTPFSYQWYVGTTGDTTTKATGTSTSATYTTPALTVASSFWVRASNSFGSADSSTATISISTGGAPVITSQPSNQSIVSAATATLRVTATGSQLRYQWYVGTSGDTTTAASGASATSRIYTTPALTTTTSFWVRVTNSNDRGSADSTTATVTVGPGFTTQPTRRAVAPTATAVFTAVASGSPTYQWQISTDAGSTWNNLSNSSTYSGVTTTTLTVTAAAALNGRQYRAVATSGSLSASSNGATLVVRAVAANFDGDGQSDIAVFRPAGGNWFFRNSSTGFAPGGAVQWAIPGDVPVPSDYDGDGKVDVAVFRPSTGDWLIRQSSTGTSASYNWGLPGDLPVPGDYDGDGKTDLAVYCGTCEAFYVLTSSSGYTSQTTKTGFLKRDIPVAGDFDGDGKADYAVYRSTTGTWVVYTSGSGSTITRTFSWGLGGDVPVPGDYDGDGITDIAVYRPSTGTWFVLQSSTAFTTSAVFQWGLTGDLPVPGDYDGDGKGDYAVYRPSNGTWFVQPSAAGAAPVSFQWGLAGDVPAATVAMQNAVAASGTSTLARLVQASDVDGDGVSDITVFRPSSQLQWTSLSSGTSFASASSRSFTLGSSSSVPTTGDFDGDGTTDAAVFEGASGIWTIRQSLLGTTNYQWGLVGDQPTPGDFDGDGVTDLAVFRPSDSTWWIRYSTTNFATSAQYQWGLPGDVTVAGDYDGDAKTDLAVYRPSTGQWFIRTSSSGYAVGSALSYQWGLNGDVSVPGDYDGDGKTDIAVYRPSTGQWFIRTSSSGYAASVTYQWGLNGDTPVPGDFDGDARTDLAVFRPSTGQWFILKSSTSFTGVATFTLGASGDIPILRRQ